MSQNLYSQSNIQTFYLKTGDIISGQVLEHDIEKGFYKVETEFGNITLLEEDLRIEKILITLKNGDTIQGSLLKETPLLFHIKTAFGKLEIKKDRVERIDFASKTTSKRIKKSKKSRWYYGDERLTDIYFDPTGYILEEGTLYLSGLSWGYGLTDRLQITSQYWNYFSGDLNIRPKWLLFKKGDIHKESSLSVGGHIHLHGSPSKFTYDKTYGWTQIGESPETASENIETDINTQNDSIWGDVFIAYTHSVLKKSGKGRNSYTLGASTTFHKANKPMPRVYAAVHTDVRQDYKIIFEAFYDPYWPSSQEFFNETQNDFPLLFDLGFIYAYNENLRVGIHFQRPTIAFYYKF